MTVFGRWLRAIGETSAVRNAALGVGALALAGGALAGPAASGEVASQSTGSPVSMVLQSQERAPAESHVDYEFERQPNFYFCGPASARIALSANGHVLGQDELARRLGTTVNGTDSAHDITRVLNEVIGDDVYGTVEIPGARASAAQTERLRADVVAAVRDGDPVVANIIGSARDADGNVHSLPGGHYLTVVGYRDDGRMVKIADPFEARGDGTYWMSVDVLADWIAGRGYSA